MSESVPSTVSVRTYRLREPQITLAEIERRIRETNFVCYSANTCWWGADTIYFRSKGGTVHLEPVGVSRDLPCDPRGGMLMQVDGRGTFGGERHDPLAFIRKAQENPSFYGRHGIAAFIAAYHGNVLTEDGTPWCFKEWSDYNALLDSNVASGTGARLADGAVPEGETP